MGLPAQRGQAGWKSCSSAACSPPQRGQKAPLIHSPSFGTRSWVFQKRGLCKSIFFFLKFSTTGVNGGTATALARLNFRHSFFLFRCGFPLNSQQTSGILSALQKQVGHLNSLTTNSMPPDHHLGEELPFLAVGFWAFSLGYPWGAILKAKWLRKRERSLHQPDPRRTSEPFFQKGIFSVPPSNNLSHFFTFWPTMISVFPSDLTLFHNENQQKDLTSHFSAQVVLLENCGQ